MPHHPPRAPLTVPITLLGILCLSSAATAQSLEPAPGNVWRHSITPYLFLPLSTTGTSTVDGSSADLDLDLSEVLDLLQGAASLRYEGWRGDYGVIVEGYYVRLGLDETLPGPIGADIDVDVRQSFVSLQGAYRFAKGTTADGRNYAVDASAGVRWNRIKQDIDISAGPGAASLGGTEDWFEPVVGLRYAVEVADDWTFGTRAELSGFGVGGDELQYVVLAGFDWQAWENTSLRIGYQFYGIDFSTDRSAGEFAYQIDQHGPYLGVTFNF